MRKVIPHDVPGLRRGRQRQEEAGRSSIDGAIRRINAALERERQHREKERQPVIDYWAGKGFEPARFASGEALELKYSESCSIRVTDRDIYEPPATLQAAVWVSFYTPDGRIVLACSAKNSEEAFVTITRLLAERGG